MKDTPSQEQTTAIAGNNPSAGKVDEITHGNAAGAEKYAASAIALEEPAGALEDCVEALKAVAHGA